MSSPSTGGAEPKPAQCPGFEPQQWRRGVCKNCFRSAERHGEHRSSSPPETEVAASTGACLQPTDKFGNNDNKTYLTTALYKSVIIIIIIIISVQAISDTEDEEKII